MDPTPIHPLCAILPDLSEWEFKSLQESIRDNGLVESILLYEDMVLDGRHREKACIEVGVTCRYEFFAGTYEQAADRVIARAYARSLDKGQRAMMAAKMATAKVGRPKESTLEESIIDKSSLQESITGEQAADKLNVGAGTVSRARAINNKSEVLAQAVLNKELSLNNAEKLMNASPAIIESALAKVRAGEPIKNVIIRNDSGKPVYTEKAIVKAFDELCRQIDGRAKVHGKCKHHTEMTKALNTFFGEYKEWLKKS